MTRSCKKGEGPGWGGKMRQGAQVGRVEGSRGCIGGGNSWTEQTLGVLGVKFEAEDRQRVDRRRIGGQQREHGGCGAGQAAGAKRTWVAGSGGREYHGRTGGRRRYALDLGRLGS